MEPWIPGKHGNHTSMNLSNRYFTPKRDAPSMVHVPFDKAIDPKGILEAMTNAGFVHGEENAVQYYLHQVDDKGREK
jgi:hypothetical protein